MADVIVALARSALADREPPTSPSARGGAPDPAEQARALAAPLLTALLAVSYNAESCTAMVEAGVLQCIAALLGRGPHADTSGATVELLWNLLEQAPALARAALSRSLPSLEALAAGAGLPVPAGGKASARANGEEAAEQQRNGSQDGSAGAGAGASFSGGGGGSRSALPPMASGAGSRLVNGSRLGSPGGGAGIGSIPVSRGSVAASGLSGIAEGSARGDGASSDAGAGSEPASPSRGAGHDDGSDWQQLPDGASAGSGSVYEAAVSLRASSPGGASALDEFGEEPDIRPLRGGGGLAMVAEESSGYGSEPPPPPPDAPVVQALADALGGLLRELLLNGFSKADKELRNDCMLVMGLLLEDAAFAAAASYSGVFEALIAAGTCPELGSAPALVANYALSTDVLDHELRLLVWAALVQVRGCGGRGRVVEGRGGCGGCVGRGRRGKVGRKRMR